MRDNNDFNDNAPTPPVDDPKPPVDLNSVFALLSRLSTSVESMDKKLNNNAAEIKATNTRFEQLQLNHPPTNEVRMSDHVSAASSTLPPASTSHASGGNNTSYAAKASTNSTNTDPKQGTTNNNFSETGWTKVPTKSKPKMDTTDTIKVESNHSGVTFPQSNNTEPAIAQNHVIFCWSWSTQPVHCKKAPDPTFNVRVLCTVFEVMIAEFIPAITITKPKVTMSAPKDRKGDQTKITGKVIVGIKIQD